MHAFRYLEPCSPRVFVLLLYSLSLCSIWIKLVLPPLSFSCFGFNTYANLFLSCFLFEFFYFMFVLVFIYCLVLVMFTFNTRIPCVLPIFDSSSCLVCCLVLCCICHDCFLLGTNCARVEVCSLSSLSIWFTWRPFSPAEDAIAYVLYDFWACMLRGEYESVTPSILVSICE